MDHGAARQVVTPFYLGESKVTNVNTLKMPLKCGVLYYGVK